MGPGDAQVAFTMLWLTIVRPRPSLLHCLNHLCHSRRVRGTLIEQNSSDRVSSAGGQFRSTVSIGHADIRRRTGAAVLEHEQSSSHIGNRDVIVTRYLVGGGVNRLCRIALFARGECTHNAMPHPNLVPGKPITSRTAQRRGILGSASSVVGLVASRPLDGSLKEGRRSVRRAPAVALKPR